MDECNPLLPGEQVAARTPHFIDKPFTILPPPPRAWCIMCQPLGNEWGQAREVAVWPGKGRGEEDSASVCTVTLRLHDTSIQ